MPNPSDDVYQEIVDSARVKTDRMNQYRSQYTENDAYRLSNAFVQYPWIQPEILVSIVLSGNDDLLPQIADYAGTQAAKAGYTPYEQMQRDEKINKVNGLALRELDNEDPDGNTLLEAQQQYFSMMANRNG